jgi:3,4-dihydroxy 2-butanone 4-phosphate synthase
MDRSVMDAARAFGQGKFVLIYDADGREEETDMCVHSLHVTPAAIRAMRRDAGGLICMTLSHQDAELACVPYMVDVQEVAADRFPLLAHLKADDIPYDAKSSFSLTVNSRRTRTGITDDDRALTIATLARLLAESPDGLPIDIGKRFRSPGHVHLLIASRGLTRKRQGHTELATALAAIAGVHQSATICEMMGPSGRALPKDAARRYARRHGHPFLEGSQVVEAFEEYWEEEGQEADADFEEMMKRTEPRPLPPRNRPMVKMACRMKRWRKKG